VVGRGGNAATRDARGKRRRRGAVFRARRARVATLVGVTASMEERWANPSSDARGAREHRRGSF
jgi:hypothetical protein